MGAAGVHVQGDAAAHVAGDLKHHGGSVVRPDFAADDERHRHLGAAVGVLRHGAGQVAGDAQRAPHVLLVHPGVVDADCEEVGVRAAAQGVGSFGGEIGFGHRPQHAQPLGGDFLELGQHVGPAELPAIVHQHLVALAHVVANVGGVRRLVGRRRPAEQPALAADQVRDLVLHRPAGALGGRRPLL